MLDCECRSFLQRIYDHTVAVKIGDICLSIAWIKTDCGRVLLNQPNLDPCMAGLTYYVNYSHCTPNFLLSLIACKGNLYKQALSEHSICKAYLIGFVLRLVLCLFSIFVTGWGFLWSVFNIQDYPAPVMFPLEFFFLTFREQCVTFLVAIPPLAQPFWTGFIERGPIVSFPYPTCVFRATVGSFPEL